MATSKTVWANVLVPILTAATGVELSGEEMAVLLGALNILLRLISGARITLGSSV